MKCLFCNSELFPIGKHKLSCSACSTIFDLESISTTGSEYVQDALMCEAIREHADNFIAVFGHTQLFTSDYKYIAYTRTKLPEDIAGMFDAVYTLGNFDRKKVKNYTVLIYYNGVFSSYLKKLLVWALQDNNSYQTLPIQTVHNCNLGKWLAFQLCYKNGPMDVLNATKDVIRELCRVTPKMQVTEEVTDTKLLISLMFNYASKNVKFCNDPKVYAQALEQYWQDRIDATDSADVLYKYKNGIEELQKRAGGEWKMLKELMELWQNETPVRYEYSTYVNICEDKICSVDEIYELLGFLKTDIHFVDVLWLKGYLVSQIVTKKDGGVDEQIRKYKEVIEQ